MRNRMFSRMLVSHMPVETTNAKDAVSFYKAAFGAKEFSQWIIGKEPDLAAEMNLKGIHVQIYERPPSALKDDEVNGWFGFCVRDTEAAMARAVEAGAVAVGEVVEFGHERQGSVMDPYGYRFDLISLAKNPPLEFVLSFKGVFCSRGLFDSDGKF
ncbi:hypothetical protein FNV43_RR22940 [Rhamnella rubrinervis]|uniref:VOC domain-containing protein n=1 Tax=Rhamnella rubrinervis TaxID=2594499 RepID=A0A8K0DV86_9ROSA|nr:hypothetical protein FNV43_RR22940 [Rhamnella rubrinervis]